MLLEDPETTRRRARRIARMLDGASGLEISVIKDKAYSGGGALPEHSFETYAVSIRPPSVSVNTLEERLRTGDPPVISRIREDALLLDARTVSDGQVKALAKCVIASLKS